MSTVSSILGVAATTSSRCLAKASAAAFFLSWRPKRDGSDLAVVMRLWIQGYVHLMCISYSSHVRHMFILALKPPIDINWYVYDHLLIIWNPLKLSIGIYCVSNLSQTIGDVLGVPHLFFVEDGHSQGYPWPRSVRNQRVAVSYHRCRYGTQLVVSTMPKGLSMTSSPPWLVSLLIVAIVGWLVPPFLHGQPHPRDLFTFVILPGH